MLTDKCFRTHVNANDKKGIIKEIADFFETAHGLDSKTVFEALWTREQKGSTGLGKELAIPHARIPGIGEMKAVVLYSENGKDFDAYDGLPTKLFFCIVIDSEGHPQEQLDMLKTIVEACEKTDLMDALTRVKNANTMRDVVLRRITEVQNG